VFASVLLVASLVMVVAGAGLAVAALRLGSRVRQTEWMLTRVDAVIKERMR
jgi:hypothetical protein